MKVMCNFEHFIDDEKKKREDIVKFIFEQERLLREKGMI